MSPLAGRLARRIALAGPLTVAQYMAEVLGHPRYGYYRTADPVGAAGDFITSPEISQMFGELIGLWCAQTWDAMGAPDPVLLVELGPGRGTLMADALRATRVVPAFADALRVHLVEISPALRAHQGRALADHSNVTWHASFAEVPEDPMILVANEFFDALPVRQFVLTPKGWRERLVGLDGSGALCWALSAGPAAPPQVGERSLPTVPGMTVEVSPQSVALAGEIGRRLAAGEGAALIVDYGDETGSSRGTLQAVRDHRRHDVLAEPGTADLTAHVDFAALAQAAREAGAATHGPVEQGRFLQHLGIDQRAARLMAGVAERQRAEIDSACRRLIADDQMGTLFKVLALTAPGVPPPAGFELGDNRNP